MRSLILFAIFVFIEINLNAQAPLPTRTQLAWHDMEFYLFVHFGPNTFTDKEWGEGTESKDIFAPTQLDCQQ